MSDDYQDAEESHGWGWIILMVIIVIAFFALLGVAAGQVPIESFLQ